MHAQTFVRQLFAPPGADAAQTRHLLAQAAGAHARLLNRLATFQPDPLKVSCHALDDYLRGPAPASDKRFLLDDPQLSEALHGLAHDAGVLAEWDTSASIGEPQGASLGQAPLGNARLGNVVAAALLRSQRGWCGRLVVATDAYGRVHFPGCDWVLVLLNETAAGRELLANQALTLELNTRRAVWTLADRLETPLVSMPRRAFDAMIVDNRAEAPADVQFCAGSISSRFERAGLLPKTCIRFEPIGGEAPSLHAEMTGGILTALMSAMGGNAPGIFDQFCQCIRTIQGFELPDYLGGQIASFSMPTTPGVIGFNVQYTDDDLPRLDPWCFLWLGHELGHTLHYLIDDVAFTHGWRFLLNAGDATPLIPRYGRALSVRTLFQIPYVHLFEWWLLMRFHERGYVDLPWRMPDDPHAIGEDLRSEIRESFDLIEQYARLTPTGLAVIARLHELVDEADGHWRQLSFAPRRATVVRRRRARPARRRPTR